MAEHDSLGPTSDQLARMVLEMAGELEADEKLIKEAILAAAESGDTERNRHNRPAMVGPSSPRGCREVVSPSNSSESRVLCYASDPTISSFY